MAGTTRGGSVIGASSTATTPSSNPDSASLPAAKADLVLPTPPGPVSVTRRTSSRRSWAATSRTSRSRPTSGVNGRGSDACDVARFERSMTRSSLSADAWLWAGCRRGQSTLPGARGSEEGRGKRTKGLGFGGGFGGGGGGEEVDQVAVEVEDREVVDAPPLGLQLAVGVDDAGRGHFLVEGGQVGGGDPAAG